MITNLIVSLCLVLGVVWGYMLFESLDLILHLVGWILIIYCIFAIVFLNFGETIKKLFNRKQ